MFTKVNKSIGSHPLDPWDDPTTQSALPERPFDVAYVAPDAAHDGLELALPPRLALGADGEVVLETYNAEGAVFIEGRVVRIDHVPPFALVHVLAWGPAAEPYEPPLYLGYLVWESTLLAPEALLAARLRQHYGATLTVHQLAAASGVVRHTVYAALRSKQLHGTKRRGEWTFTPEQAAAWLPRVRPRRKAMR